jgi:hypothetical protein
MDNISEWSISAHDLFTWGEKELKPAADRAFAGEGDFVPGEWCRFCKAKKTCRAYAKEMMALAALDFKEPDLLDEEEIEQIVLRWSDLEKWIKAVKEHAMALALGGRKFGGLKLVSGRSNRRIQNEIAASQVLLGAGLSEDQVFVKELATITTLEKIMGKKIFAEVLKDYIVKPEGAPVLVSIDDKREELKSGAVKDFQNE